jgi:hypothetical protein
MIAAFFWCNLKVLNYVCHSVQRVKQRHNPNHAEENPPAEEQQLCITTLMHMLKPVISAETLP